MKSVTIDEDKLEEFVKSAVLEIFEKKQDLITDLLSDALLDIGLGYAIQEGEKTPLISREELFNIIESK